MDIALSADALRAAIENEPQKADLHYLLGAELAQQRNYDGAVLAMSRALELDPSLHSCRFQLGLLLLTMALPDRARAVWLDLENMGSASALWHFKRGLEALCLCELVAKRDRAQRFQPGAQSRHAACHRPGDRGTRANAASFQRAARSG